MFIIQFHVQYIKSTLRHREMYTADVQFVSELVNHTHWPSR